MPRKAAKTEAEPAKVLRAIKGFDANLACEPESGNRVEYVVGQTYVHEGNVECCVSGFHAVTGHPLAVFSYYPPAGSRYCRVELSGRFDTDGDDDKTCAEILKVGEEIGIAGLVAEAVAWAQERTHPEGKTATGDQGAASATGDYGAASATGDQGAAMASGYLGQVSGKDGNALFAVEREVWDGPILSVACGIVGHDGIKEGVWYRCLGGKLVEAA